MRYKSKSNLFILLVILVLSFVYQVKSEVAQSYSKEDISIILKSAEQQFPNISFDYTSQMKLPNGREYEKRTITGHVAKTSQGYIFNEEQRVYTNSTQQTQKEEPGYIFAYNGDRIFQLDRQTDENRHNSMMHASIHEDKKTIAPILSRLPDAYIWKFGEVYFSDLLVDDEYGMEIVSNQEQLNGESAVLLEGNAGDGLKLLLWLSSEKNFMPLRVKMIREKDNYAIDLNYGNYVKMSNGLYYPQRVFWIGPDGAVSNEISIENISIAPIPDELFTPEAPPNTHITDHLLKIAYTTESAGDISLESTNELPAVDDVRSNDVRQESLDRYLETAKSEDGGKGINKGGSNNCF
ncbi:MAG: hypothetical protein JW725_03100 [Candidatus Babeliaceae bacterium]|nr:hypothetical protein [Candidatus Babeliaceae bacterium]